MFFKYQLVYDTSISLLIPLNVEQIFSYQGDI